MAEDFDIVVFGGCGDLAQRKLIPALYRALLEDKVAKGARFLVTCRSLESAAEYTQIARAALDEHLPADQFNESVWDEFQSRLIAVSLDIGELDQAWRELSEHLAEYPDRVRVFYLAIPPTIFGTCCKHLADAGLVNDQSRLVVEKPIGYNAESADAINTEIARYFSEASIYRIDHYLGKETVQNLMALRFTNLMFSRLWDANSIDHVQISISETVGLEGRAGFYNDAGALRDMVQNHLLQLLCLVAMESPHKLNANSIRAEKLKVLEALRPIRADEVSENTVRGQYVAGSYDGKMVPGYFEELGSADSTTETFVALKVHIDNWRWAQVPFYLRTGKRMAKRCAEIIIQFKEVPHRVYEDSAGEMSANRLVIRLQPDEAIQLQMMSKNLETLDMQLQPVSLDLNFSDTYSEFQSDAYKRLILDAASGNSSLFIHRDEVDAAWGWVDPIIDAWQQAKSDIHLYRAGTWGPDEAKELLERDGRRWYNAGEAALD